MLFKFNVARKYLFRIVSQTLVSYRGSALSNEDALTPFAAAIACRGWRQNHLQ